MQLPVLSAVQRSPEQVGTPLLDNYGRAITYLRLAVTDRCNLRCTYCMPEHMRFLPTKELLSDEEIMRLVEICGELGIRKIRVTGGEPFVRKGIMELLWNIKKTRGIEEVHITTNGVLTAPYVPELVKMGIASVNLSIDTFNEGRFVELTRRNEFTAVMQSFEALAASPIPLSVNAVIMDGKNTDDVIAMCEQTKYTDFSMRFIEEMPFNGGTHELIAPLWTHAQILSEIRAAYPHLQKLEKNDPAATADLYQIPGYAGKIGIIAGFSRTFCGACNRIRITAKGMLKTCLYDNGAVNLKSLLRNEASNDKIRATITDATFQRFRDGFEAERHTHASRVFDSMSEIGG